MPPFREDGGPQVGGGTREDARGDAVEAASGSGAAAFPQAGKRADVQCCLAQESARARNHANSAMQRKVVSVWTWSACEVLISKDGRDDGDDHEADDAAQQDHNRFHEDVTA